MENNGVTPKSLICSLISEELIRFKKWLFNVLDDLPASVMDHSAYIELLSDVHYCICDFIMEYCDEKDKGNVLQED